MHPSSFDKPTSPSKARRLFQGLDVDFPKDLCLGLNGKGTPNSLPKALNSNSHLLARRGRKCGPEEQLSRRRALVAQEPAALANQHALADTGEEDLVFEGDDGFGARRGVLGDIDLEPELGEVSLRGHGEGVEAGGTHEHARSWRVPLHQVLGQELLTGGEDGVTALGVLKAHVHQPAQIAVMAPRLIEQLIEKKLADTARVLAADLVVAHEALDDLLAGRDPADASAGCDDLAEGVEAHDAPVDIHAEQRWHQLAQELLVVGWWGHGGGVGASVRLHLEEVVGLVFDDEDVVLLAHFVEGLATFAALGCAAGILTGGDGVQKVWLACAAGLDVPVAEDVVHVLWDQALGVHLDSQELAAQWQSGLDGAREGVFLSEDVVAALGEHAVGLLEGVGASDRECALPILVWRVIDDLGVLDDEAEQLGRASSLTVVETDGEIVGSIALRGVVLSSLDNGAALLCVLLSELRGSRDCHGDVLNREVLAAWQTASKGYDTWCLEVLYRSLQRRSAACLAFGAEQVCCESVCDMKMNLKRQQLTIKTLGWLAMSLHQSA